MQPISLPVDRYFDPEPRQKEIALQLYDQVKDVPLICPHGHVDPRMFAEPDYSFGSPADLLIIPDHYVFRMLYSQGVPLEQLGIARRDGVQVIDPANSASVERDHRKIWQTFAENFFLFRGTPTGMWLTHELASVFGVDEKLTGESAQRIYDQIAAKLATPDFRPRKLFERFNIEVLSTTDAATDSLAHHRAIRESSWRGRVIPTFRPDAVVNIDTPGWRKSIDALSEVSGIDINGYRAFVQTLEDRRAFFKSMGATATDHGAQTAWTEALSDAEADAIFQRALR
ncbi:MAG: glucuronate isomerase, partial [Chloroflexota bacterium]|nr:glucuronate isomerase [Chloroflexota bacterium]